jgi:DNA-binding MarR family transcriptional regulator
MLEAESLTPTMQENGSSARLRRTPCACAAARRTARAVTQLYDLVLSPTGLKATQFIILREIAMAGELAQWQLADGYAIATETLSRRLSMARAKGLLEVRRGANRGERIYRLTAFGHECLQKATPYWERAQQRLAQALGNGDLEATVQLLDRITLAAQAASEMRTRNTQAKHAQTGPK